MCMEQGVPSPQTNVSRSGFFSGGGFLNTVSSTQQVVGLGVQ